MPAPCALARASAICTAYFNACAGRIPLGASQLVEGLALDVLHHDEVRAVLGADVVDGDDVGMVQSAGGLGLLHEALLAAGVGDLVGGQDLDRHGAIQMGVACLVDHTHAAFTELRFDPVVVERLADHREAGRLWPSILGFAQK